MRHFREMAALILALTFFSLARGTTLPKAALVLAKAASLCGAEDTYYLTQASPQEKELRWLLNFVLTESEIGDYSFHESSGTEIPPSALPDFLKAQESKNFLNSALIDALKTLAAQRTGLASLRKDWATKKGAASQDPAVRGLVKKYSQAKDLSLDALKNTYAIRVANTGADCD